MDEKEKRIKKVLEILKEKGMDTSRLEKELIPHSEEVKLKTKKKKS